MVDDVPCYVMVRIQQRRAELGLKGSFYLARLEIDILTNIKKPCMIHVFIVLMEFGYL